MIAPFPPPCLMLPGLSYSSNQSTTAVHEFLSTMVHSRALPRTPRTWTSFAPSIRLRSHDSQLQCCQSCQSLETTGNKGRDTGKLNDRRHQGRKNKAHLATVSVTTPPSETAHAVSFTSSNSVNAAYLPLLLLPMHSGPPTATRVRTASRSPIACKLHQIHLHLSLLCHEIHFWHLGLQEHTSPHRTSAASAQV